MVEKLLAAANPQKRLFISLITRDISLADAILDIVDNSINAALEPLADHLKTADDYQRLLSNKKIKPKVEINIRVNTTRIAVDDNASGISLAMAQNHVFKFGRDEADENSSDRLSVYGIGLKRAMFKCGNFVTITSDHKSGGFQLRLPSVREWAADTTEPWTFPITTRDPTRTGCGTHIQITQLHDDVLRRIEDGLFLDQLRERIARTYSFYVGRIVDIVLNNTKIEREQLEIGGNHSSQKFRSDSVTCNVTAGIALVAGDVFRERNSGWFVFCNGRAVLFADKSALTGWGAGLPLFQAKHRPFLGTVFFVSPNAEALPWTTTKSSVNEESVVWQEARRHMVAIGRIVTRFLDSRYTDEGTVVAPSDLSDATGKRMSVLEAAVGEERSFKAPSAKEVKRTTIVSYPARITELKMIEDHLRRRMSASGIGKYTFDFYLKNEVGEAE